jgi:predicted acyl esterase
VTWGGSALAVTQVMMAPGAPSALKAQFISQGFSDYYQHGAYQGGCFREVLIKGWLDDNRFDWRHQDNWPPSARNWNLYLHPEGLLKDVPPELEEIGSRTYEYDPDKPVPTIGGNNIRIAAGPLDQRPLEGRPDVLLFTTDVLEPWGERLLSTNKPK